MAWVTNDPSITTGGIITAPEQGTCYVCQRKLPEERRWLAFLLHGGPSRRCRGRRNWIRCWGDFLVANGLSASMPTVPAWLLGRSHALYFTNVVDLLTSYEKYAREDNGQDQVRFTQGVVSQAGLAEIHRQAKGRTLNDLSRRWRRTLGHGL